MGVKKLSIALGIVFGSLLAALMVLPGLLDWNAYRDEIAGRISAAIGRTVELKGDARLTLLPTPAFSVTNARIANPAGFGDPDMVRLKRLDVAIAFGPLLTGRIQVERVALIEPEIRIDIAENGVSNWSVASIFDNAVAKTFSFDNVMVRDGRVVVRDQRNGREETAEGVNGHVVAGSLAGPFQVDATFSWRGVDVRGEVTTGRFGGGAASPVRASFSLPGGNATAKLAGIIAADAAGRPRFQGDVRADGGNLAATVLPILAAVNNHSLPSQAFDRPFSIRAAVEASEDRTTLGNLELQLGDVQAEGTVSVATGAVPDVRVALKANTFDLDPWLEGTDGAFRLPVPEGVTGKIDLSLDAVGLAGGALRQARLEARLDNGRMSLERVAALLPGGADVAAAGSLEMQDGIPILDLQVEANADNLRGVLDWLRIDAKDVPADRLRKTTLTGRLRGSTGRYDLTGIDLRVDTSRVTGALSYADRGRPAFGVQLDVDRLNADAYFPKTLPMLADLGQLFEKVDLNLSLTAQNLTMAGVPVQGLSLDATVVGGAVDVKELKVTDIAGIAGKLGGRLRGISADEPANVTIDAETDSLSGFARHFLWPAVLPEPERFGPVRLHARLVGNSEKQALELKVQVAGGTIEAGGALDGGLAAPHADLKVRAIHPDAADLIRQVFGIGGTAASSGPLDLYAAIDGKTSGLAFSGIQGNVLGTAVRGNLFVDANDRRPRIEGDLQFGDLDADRLLAACRDAVDSLDVLSGSWIRAADARLAITAAGLSAANLRLDNPAARVTLDRGILTLVQLDGGFLGGRLGATGHIASSADEPLHAELGLTVAHAQPADTSLGDGLTLSAGSADLELELNTTGSTGMALIHALAGRGWFAMRNGVLGGIDFGALLERAGTPSADGFSGGRTPFVSADGHIAVDRGIVHSNDLRFVFNESTAVAGGDLRLDDRTVDLGIKLDGKGKTPSVLHVTGPIAKPVMTLDVTSLKENGAESAPDNESAAPSVAAAPPAGNDVIRNRLGELRR